jgi:DNA-binding NtrC family response regulator
MVPSILIVDDEKNIRDTLNRYLSRSFKTYMATNGIDAMKVLRRNQEIEIVLSDINMQGMDGLELLKNIKSIDTEKTVILMSGLYSIESALRAFRNGAYNYLSKPVDLTTLETVLNSAMKDMGIINHKKVSFDLNVH